MSVKVFKLDNEEIIRKLKCWAEMQSDNENIAGIILFGSLAKREATPASDADIIIILKDSKEEFKDRIPHFIPEKVGLSVDIFPYTIGEFKALLDENSGLAKEALESGILLYGINASDDQGVRDWLNSLTRDGEK